MIADYIIRFGEKVEIRVPYGDGHIQWKRLGKGGDDWKTVGVGNGGYVGFFLNALAFEHPKNQTVVMYKVLMHVFTNPPKGDNSFGRPYWNGWQGHFEFDIDTLEIVPVPYNRESVSVKYNEWNDGVYGQREVSKSDILDVDDIEFFDEI